MVGFLFTTALSLVITAVLLLLCSMRTYWVFYFAFSILLGSSQVVDSTSGPQSNGEGLYFSDGRRKVDYVLVFHQRRHGSIRSPTSTSVSHDRLSIVSNGNFPQSAGLHAAAGVGGAIPAGEAANVDEVFMELGFAGGNEPAEPADHEMHLIRQEFEANLLEAGLEIERDGEVSAWSCHLNTLKTHRCASLTLDTGMIIIATKTRPCNAKGKYIGKETPQPELTQTRFTLTNTLTFDLWQDLYLH